MSRAIDRTDPPPTGTKPASVENPLLYTFLAICESCNVVWVSACFLHAHFALVAQKLPWLCPDCHRGLALQAVRKRDQPEGKPC
jgi:hypothetical protein